MDPACMSVGKETGLGGDIPHLHRGVRAGRGNERTIRRPGHTANSVTMPWIIRQQGAIRGIPHLNRVIDPSGSDIFPVRRPGHSVNRCGVTSIGENGCAIVRVPNLHSLVDPSRSNTLPIRGRTDGINFGDMAGIGETLYATDGIPHLHSFVHARRCDLLLIRQEPGKSHDRCRMTSVSKQITPSSGIPHLDRVICAAGGDALPIVRPSYAKHPVFVALIGVHAIATGRVPHMYLSISRPRDDAFVVRGPGYAVYFIGMTFVCYEQFRLKLYKRGGTGRCGCRSA